MTTDRYTIADALLGHGLALFDIVSGERRPATGWQRRCTTNHRHVHAWVRAGDNLGVGCRASNVAVLDLDRHAGEPDGLLRFAALCDQHGQSWPETLSSITPNGGQHLFFRVPAERIVLSSSGPRSPLGPSIDVRGPGREIGGYVVAPGSIVPAEEYRILHDHPIAVLPAWLAEKISEPLSRPLRIKVPKAHSPYCRCRECRRRCQPGR